MPYRPGHLAEQRLHEGAVEEEEGSRAEEVEGEEPGGRRHHDVQESDVHGLAELRGEEPLPRRPEQGEGSQGDPLHVSLGEARDTSWFYEVQSCAGSPLESLKKDIIFDA